MKKNPSVQKSAKAVPPDLQSMLLQSIPDASLKLTTLPQCPGISLWLLDADYPQWKLDHDQASHIMENPPFWSFCWASGQVLATYLLDNPDIVRNRTLVDFGAGSGIVGIAAKMAGAKSVIACDADPIARLACEANAAINKVSLTTIDSMENIADADIVTVADVFYDRDNLPLLGALKQKFDTLWIADSRLKRSEITDPTLSCLEYVESFQSFTVPDLAESSEFNHVSLYTNRRFEPGCHYGP